MTEEDDDDDKPIYEVIAAESATPNADGTYVELSLRMEGEPLHLAFPTEQLPVLVALLSQAANQAYAIAGTVQHQESLEMVGSEVFRDGSDVGIHFRLVGGLFLPIGMTVQDAIDLHARLGASLATKSSSRPDASRH